MTEPTHVCPSCGKPLAANAPKGLCPECLMKGAFPTGTDPAAESAGTKPPRFVPPKPEDLAAFFPGLEILEFAGQGGMGAVYKARQKELDRVVALKILPPGIGDDAGFAERFTREARALAKLNHPNIVTLFEFGRADGLYFFLMEFVEGVTLRQLLNAGRISSREALAIVPQICDALQFAHDQGIVHRDIKPENVLLDRRGRVKVADFGLAKLVGVGNEPAGAGTAAVAAPSLTAAGKMMGTPNYMAPEQRERPGEVDNRADIYALGVVFYQMLTGELPVKRIEPPSRKVHIDVRLDDVVLRALEDKPELRFQNVDEVKTCVETIVAGGSRQEGRRERSVGGSGNAESGTRPIQPIEIPERYKPWVLIGVIVIGVLLLPGTLALVGRLGGAIDESALNPGAVFVTYVTLALAGGLAWMGWKWFRGLLQKVLVLAPDDQGKVGALDGALRVCILALYWVVALRVLPAFWNLMVGLTRGSLPGGLILLGLAVVLYLSLRRLGSRNPDCTMNESGTSRGTAMSGPPRYSLTAIAGAIWAGTALSLFVLHAFRIDIYDLLPSGSGLLLVFGAPLGTTFLGWVAVGQIRRSGGRLTGLRLAVFDGLIFPMLLLDSMVVWGSVVGARMLWRDWRGYLPMPFGNFTGPWVGRPWFLVGVAVAFALVVLTNYLLGRRVWKAVNREVRSEHSTAV